MDPSASGFTSSVLKKKKKMCSCCCFGVPPLLFQLCKGKELPAAPVCKAEVYFLFGVTGKLQLERSTVHGYHTSQTDIKPV